LKARKINRLDEARRGVDLKELRSGGVNRDQTIWFGVSRFRPQSGPVIGGFERLVVNPKPPSAEDLLAMPGRRKLHEQTKPQLDVGWPRPRLETNRYLFSITWAGSVTT
jgi:hypothetical protein